MKYKYALILLFMLHGSLGYAYLTSDRPNQNLPSYDYYPKKRITITGYPVILDDQHGVYNVPDNYRAYTENNFVTIDNIKHVCYAQPQAKLSVLNKKLINVNLHGTIVEWICYRYDENYFVFSP